MLKIQWAAGELTKDYTFSLEPIRPAAKPVSAADLIGLIRTARLNCM